MFRCMYKVCNTLVLQNAIKASYSTAAFQFLDIDDSNKGYKIIQMKKKPVNSLNLEMINELIGAVNLVENDKQSRGLIIASNLPVFSAGLDILEMYKPQSERLHDFWVNTQELKLRLFSSPLVLISAINGACPAGGCIMAFSSDYRIMADGKHTIGLNETKLGLAAPFWLCESLKLLVGHREAEKMLFCSILLTPKEALKTGVVDEVVSAEELMEVSKKEMEKWLSIADVGRIRTKSLMRKHFLEEFHARREEDLNAFLKFVQSPLLQKHLAKYIESLKKK